MGSKYFWKCVGIRAIKTFSQTMLSLVTVGQAFGEVGWQNVLSVSCTAALLSVLTSFAGLPEVKPEESEQKKEEG